MKRQIFENQVRLEYNGDTSEIYVDDFPVASVDARIDLQYCYEILENMGYTVVMDLFLEPMKPEEILYTYRNSQQISSQTGLICYVRADMGTNGNEFWSTWNRFRDDLDTPEFRNRTDNVFYALRNNNGFLSNRSTLARYCLSCDVLPFDTGRDYGVRINSGEYAYLMRLNPHKGEYNLYCYCYRRDWLDSHLERAKRGIRFVDSQYHEKFRLADGDEIIIMGEPNGFTVREVPARYVCRYVDDSHFEYGPNLRHICEFAELLEKNNYSVIPLRASLPEKAYVYVESVNRIGVVTKGESGYRPLDISFYNKQDGMEIVDTNNKKLGISKAQAAAMKCGSIFGWQTPLADPKNYDDNGIPIKAKSTVRETVR